MILNGINVPEKVGHNYTPIKLENIEQLTQYKHRVRMLTFLEKKPICVNCGKEGKYIIHGQDTHGRPTIHIDVYTEDFELMTCDHIIPKSKGGLKVIENLQPMCNTCNHSKGDK